MKIRLYKIIPLILLLAIGSSGCSSFSYYAHVMNGHQELMEAEEDIKDILAQKKYDEKIRARLALALQIRQFATDKLGLPDNDSYKTFVKLNRRYPVWNVIAAKRFSVEAKQWCFLIVGCISYRGYFDEQDAGTEAAELKTEGYDVAVAPVAAYSTLGWFDDPLLSSMLYRDDARLAGIIFHELAHQKIYVDDDSSFNEAFATTVELEGVRRWLAARGNREGIAHYRQYKQRQEAFNRLLQATRNKLKVLYQTHEAAPAMLAQKQNTFAQMKKDYRRLKKSWGGYAGYDQWMQRDINNADLALVATYHELVPAFETILRQQHNDLPKFYTAVEKTVDLPKAQRIELFNHLSQQLAKRNKTE